MDVPAAKGGERGGKVTPFHLSSDDRDRTSESSLLTAAGPKQPLQSKRFRASVEFSAADRLHHNHLHHIRYVALGAFQRECLHADVIGPSGQALHHVAADTG